MINSGAKGTYAEFMVFLLVYASYADYELSTSEITRIKSKFDPSLVDQVISHYERMSDYERLNYIMQNKSKYFQSEKDIQSVMDEIELQFKSDGEYSKLEKGLNNFLHHMLNEDWKSNS